MWKQPEYHSIIYTYKAEILFKYGLVLHFKTS